MTWQKLYLGDVMDALKMIPSESVDCVVTSPPYWGLRDYGCEGQIGLEKTPEEYVAKMVEVFREVRRVLKKEGTLFLNLGDSYAGSGKGRNADGTPGKTESLNKNNRGSMSGVILPSSVGSEESYDTSDKEVEDYPKNDCLCENLCDACRRAYQIGKFHSENSLVPKQVFLPSSPNHERKESVSDHFPTSDFSHRDYRNTTAKQDSVSSLIHEAEQVLSSQESNFSSSSCELKENVSNQNHEAKCLLCGCSFLSDVQVSEHKKVCNCGIEMPSDALNQSRLGNVSLGLAYPNYSRSFLKSKDLVGIPWRVAFALQADGWYLRQDIIWSKPNCMPESVTDRCTKSHEYVFLLAKSQHYFYDAEAIKLPVADSTIGRGIVDFGGEKGRDYKANIKPNDPNYRGGSEQWGRTFDYEESCANGRNRRSVWTITTKPFSGAHFATFPPDLIEPMIKAGTSEKGVCPKCGKAWERVTEEKKVPPIEIYDGQSTKDYSLAHAQNPSDTKRRILEAMRTEVKTLGWQPSCKCGVPPVPAVVLDPFMGAGTTFLVARELGRNCIGIELNPKYAEIMKKRLGWNNQLQKTYEIIEAKP